MKVTEHGLFDEGNSSDNIKTLSKQNSDIVTLGSNNRVTFKSSVSNDKLSGNLVNFSKQESVMTRLYSQQNQNHEALRTVPVGLNTCT